MNNLRIFQFSLPVLFIVLLSPTMRLCAQMEVPLTVQQAAYPGVLVTPRTEDPLTAGIPLPDSAGIRDVSQIGLVGTNCGQFRILGRWPSGNAKWVLVDTQTDLEPSGKNPKVVLTLGRGNFGGEPLAREDPSRIVVTTGAAEFTIRRSRFNLFERVVVHGKTLVSPGTSKGLVLLGPPPNQTACGVCKTIYSSSNDPLSDVKIEENGPVRAVVKAMGAHKDSQGNVYMRFTTRMTFYRGKSYVKVTTSLRNADDKASQFNAAYKGFASYEAQVTLLLGPQKSFSFGTHAGVLADALHGSEDVYLYQGYSQKLEHYHWWQERPGEYSGQHLEDVKPYIRRTKSSESRTGWVYDQEGYKVVRGAKTLASGASDQFPEGWADLHDATGTGVLIGVQEFAAFWPKSLEFRSGGSDVRIGIWPKYNAQPYFQAWPQYSTHDLWFDFHDASPASLSEGFHKLQHSLLARAPITHYNNAKVFPFELIDPQEEDEYYKSIGVACCIADMAPTVFRFYYWPQPGEENQIELRWAYLLQWLARGLTGRYLTAGYFYRFLADQAFPRSDGFDWRKYPPSQLDYWGFPAGHSFNQQRAHRPWIDQNHAHWYGMTDYYFLTGDENIRDALLDGVKDRFLNQEAKLNTGSLGSARAIGAALMGFVRLYKFLDEIHDPDADLTLAVAQNVVKREVLPELKLSGFGMAPNGISRTRGVYGNAGSVSRYRRVLEARNAQTFMHSILIEGMWEYAQARGPAWSGYDEMMDLAYAAGQWAVHEMFVDTGELAGSGFRYLILLDYPNNPTENPDFHVSALSVTLFPFFILHEYTGDISWKRKFEIALRKSSENSGKEWPLAATYNVSEVVRRVVHPESRPRLAEVPLRVRSDGLGTVEVTWIAPEGAQAYKFKFVEDRRIVEWLEFDPVSNSFGLDPYRYCPWFAARTLPDPPKPGRVGSTETLTLSGLDPAKAWSFSLRAYVPQ